MSFASELIMSLVPLKAVSVPLLIILGFVLLMKAGDKLVESAEEIGVIFKWSPIFIGVFILGLGTSLPEIISTLYAAISGSTTLGLANIVGSNIANLGLILGLGLVGIALSKQRLYPTKAKMDFVLMLLATVLLVVSYHFTGGVDLAFGITFCALLATGLYLSLQSSKAQMAEAELEEIAAHRPKLLPAAIGVAISLCLLILGANLLVDGAVITATSLGVSERFIGVSLVALGTSLPEVSATLAAIKRKQAGMILGNVFGSNMLNIYAAGGLTALITPLKAENMATDIWIMLAFTLLTLPLFWHHKKKHILTTGVILLAGYISYMGYLVFTMNV